MKHPWMCLIFGILIAVAIFCGGFLAGNQYNLNLRQVTTQSQMEEKLVNWVYSKSERVSIDTCRQIVKESMKTKYPLLMLSLIETESNFIPSAQSSKGAMGLTQVVPKYHRQALIKAGIIKIDRDLFNIGASIQAGNVILSEHLKSCNNDVTKALEKYLGGRDGPYVRRILSNLASLYIITSQ